ncbi:MAG: extracellular solute-binding protein [Caloramator sp.]|nr:extracellular solute-binding protein [Caloramator sp.]
MKKNKIIIFLLIIILMLSCGHEKNNKTISSQIKGTEKFISKELVTLVWATHENYYESASLNNNLEVWNEIQRKTNVKIKWDVLPSSQYDYEMQMRLITNNNLLDLVVVPNYDPTPYGQAGILIPLEGLIEKYAPNIKKVFLKYPSSKELMTSADGHIYGLSSIIEGSMDTLQPTFAIRKDWLQKLHLNEPESIEDWVKVLKAFRDKDPNGNGINDEVPFCSNPFYFSEAFGLQLMSGSDYIVKNGQVKYQWAEPNMKEFLIFANKLYKERLIDENYLGLTRQIIKSKVINNKVGVFVTYPDWIISWQKKLQLTNCNEATYIPILPPKGLNAERTLDTTNIIDKRFSGITKKCKNPIIAIKFLDYLWSNEGQRYMAWGIENKTYIIENGIPKFTKYVIYNKDGLGVSDVLRTVGAWPTIPWVQQREQYIQMLSILPNFENYHIMIKPILKEPFPMLLANKNEQEKLIKIETDITNYKNCIINEFIIGKEPINNFDKYINILNNMGLKEVISIKQAQYDRYIKSINK